VVQIIRPGTGGSAECLRLLLERIDRSRFDIEIIASPLEDPTYPQSLAAMGFPVHLVDMHRPIRPTADLSAFVQIARLLNRIAPHVIHAHTSKPGFFVARAKRDGLLRPQPNSSPRIIYSPHGPYFRYGHSSLKRSFYRALEQIARLSTDIVVAVAHSEGDEIVEAGIVPRHKIRVIPNGIDIHRFRSLPDPNSLLEKFAVPTASTRIGMIGRLDPPKDPFTFLNAARTLREERPDLRFLLIGTGTQEDEIDARIRELGLEGTVVRTGFLEATEAMSLLDIGVLSSTSEGLPLVLLELLASGVPVVSTDLPGCREALDNGRCGLLVPPGDPMRLAQAMTEILEKPQERDLRVQSGREHVQNHHHLDSWAEQIQALYESSPKPLKTF
jgi:glycosyltransferase involved in cell wall biosynthesis